MTSTRELYNSSPDSIFDNNFPTTTTTTPVFDNNNNNGGVGGEENKSVLSYNSGFTELINERYNNNNNNKQRHSSIVDWPSPPVNNSDNNNNNNNNDGESYDDNNTMRRRDPSPPHTTNKSSKVNLARQIIYKRNNNINNSMTDNTRQAPRADTLREVSKRLERGVDPTSISSVQSNYESNNVNQSKEEVANNNNSSGKKKKKLDPPSSLAVDSTSTIVNQKQITKKQSIKQQQPTARQSAITRQSTTTKQSTTSKSITTSNNNIMQRHFQKHNLPSPISGTPLSPQSGSSSIVGTINTSNSILTDEMNDEQLLQRRLHNLKQKQRKSRGGGVRQSNVKPSSVNQYSGMSSNNKSNVKQSSQKKRIVSQKSNLNQGSSDKKMRDQLQKHLGVQQSKSNMEGRRVVATPPSSSAAQVSSGVQGDKKGGMQQQGSRLARQGWINDNSNNTSHQGQQGSSSSSSSSSSNSHQARQEEGMLQQLYSPLERTTNKQSTRPPYNNVSSAANLRVVSPQDVTQKKEKSSDSSNNSNVEASKSDTSITIRNNHPHDGPAPLAIIQRQRQKRNIVTQQSTSTPPPAPATMTVQQQQRPPTHPDSSRTISPSSDNDNNNNNVPSTGRIQSRHRIKGGASTTTSPSMNPSPTSVISSSPSTSISTSNAQQPRGGVQQSRGSAQQPQQQHATTQRTLLSPVRSDHSADAAAGNFHVNFGNVRRRIFDNNSNNSSSSIVRGRAGGSSSNGGIGGSNDYEGVQMLQQRQRPPLSPLDESSTLNDDSVSSRRVQQDPPPQSSPDRNGMNNNNSTSSPKRSLASSRSIFRLNPSVIKRRASPPTTTTNNNINNNKNNNTIQGQGQGSGDRGVNGRDVSPSISVDTFNECVQLSPGSSYANNNNANNSGESFDRRGNLTVVSWNDDDEDTSNNKDKDDNGESIKGDEYTIPLGEKLSKLHNQQPNMTSIKRSGMGRSFDSATNQSKVSRYSSSKSGMSYGGNSIQPSVESECVRQNAEIAIAMGDMMEFFLGVDEAEKDEAEEGEGADNGAFDMSSTTPQSKQQIPISFNRQNLPIRNDMKQPSLVSGTSGASTSIFEAFEVAPNTSHGHTTKLSINDINVQHQAHVKKRGTKKRKASLPLVTESNTTSKDIGGSTSFDQVTRRVSSEDSEPPLKVSRSFDSSAVVSIQPSIDSECVRQNDNIAIQMGDMMQMFMETPENEYVDLPIDEQVYVEEEIYVEEESYEDQIMHNSGGGLEPLAEDEVYESESPGHQVQYDYQDPRSTKTNQYTTLNPGRVVSPSTTMSGSSPGSSHMTPTASNIKVIPQQSRMSSSHLLMPSTSEEEEYDDPSVFGSASMMSDSSSEMTPMITRPVPPVQTRQPPSQKQVTNKKNHNSLINKNKNLANFLDSFSDHLLRGCNDNDDDDASTDVFFVNNSQFGKDTSQFNDSQFSSTSSNGVGINQFDLPKHPLNQALPVTTNSDKLEEEVEEVITDQQIAQFQRWKQLNKSNQTPNNNRGLPKPSTFMSAKERTRIRKHDTTPQRTNTSRAQRGRMSLRRAPSFASEVSMSSIKEDMAEEEDEIVLEPMTVEEASDESSSSSSDNEHVISSESEGSDTSSESSGRGNSNRQVDDNREPSVRSEDPPSSQDPPTQSSSTRKSTGGNEININRQLSPDASRQSSDPPDADDMIKMTNREMRKGSSLAWNSSNGVNDDELYDTNHLPSRANRAATLAGRLNLLSITSNNASFQKYYHDSQKSRAQRRRGVRSLYRSNYEPDIEFIQEEEYEASALEEVMDQEEDGGSDDEDMIDSWDQGEEDEEEVVSECYSHDDFVKDFKEIMAREKAIATAVETKKQHQSPLAMEASKHASNIGRNHQKQGRDDKATVATSRRNKGGSGRALKSSRRPPTQPIRRQQSAHPHDIPNELPKSRLEEKLLNMKRADRRHNVETSSVATSDLGSLISRNSDKSHVIGVPKTIFHRTHPSSSRGGSSVVCGRGGSVSSQMSSLQNTTPGSTTAPKTPMTVAELRARGYNKAIVPSILPPDRNDDADTLDEDNSLLVSLPGNNNDDDDMKMLGLEGYTKSTQPPTIKRKTAPQITPTKETYDGVNVLLDTKPRWSPTADLKKIDEELQRTQAQNSKQKASHVDTSSVDKKKNVTALPAAAIQKSNRVDSDVEGNVRSSISIQEVRQPQVQVADDQLPKMRIGTETWKLKYDMVDRTSVPPPSSAAPTPTRSNIKSSPLSLKNISPLRKKQVNVSSNKVAKQPPSSAKPLETIGTIDNGMNQGRIKIQVTSRTPKQMPPSALRNSAPPATADPTASTINNNPSLEMKRHNSVPVQRHSSLKDAASLQRIRSLDAQKALSFWKYLNPHDNSGTTGSSAASKVTVNKTSRSSPIPPPPAPPPQQRQIPSSFNPPRRVHQPSIVSGTSHSSIFEAFEIAPLHTAHGNTRLELNSFGVHHAYVKRGGSKAKKRVGFPETQQMSRQTRSTPISSSGGVEPPSQSINAPIPLGGRSRTYECQSSSGNDMVAAPLTSRSRSYDNDAQEFEVMLNNRKLQPSPPPPPPPPSRGSKWVRMGWKKMNPSNGRSVRGSVQSLKKMKSLSKTQGSTSGRGSIEPDKKWVARTNVDGSVEFIQQVIPASMYK